MNPFEFLRKWEYKVPKPKPPPPTFQQFTEQQKYELRLQEIEKESQKKINDIQKKFEELQQQVLAQTSKGKGRGKGASGASARSSTRTIRESLQNVEVDEDRREGNSKEESILYIDIKTPINLL